MSRLATALPGHAVAGDGFLSLPSVWNAVSLEAGLEVIEVEVSTAFFALCLVLPWIWWL